jgi:exopolysaccharide biosynthesis polyprenyl glycosylphosphotransferase
MAAPDLVTSNLRTATLAPSRHERRAIGAGLSRVPTALAEACCDFLASAVGMLASFFLCASWSIGALPHDSMQEAIAISAVYGVLVTALLEREGGYRGGNGLLRIRETERAIRISVQSFVLLLLFSALLGLRIPFLVVSIAMIVNPMLLILEKQFIFTIARRIQWKGGNMRRVAIYGSGAAGRSVISTLLDSPRLEFRPIAVIDDSPAQFGRSMPALGYRNRRAVAIRPGPITAALLASLQCDLLLVTTLELSSYELNAVQAAADEAAVEIAFLRGAELHECQAECLDIDGLQFASSFVRRHSPLEAAAKRITDVIVSLGLLIFLAPILFLIALLIRMDSPGPALLVQKRAGRNSELFAMFKFRSMYIDAPRYSFSPTSSSDQRITRIGRFLRRMNLDELPQLLNVLMGTMSLVGPRPEMPFIVERYNAKQRQRLQVIPGITGLWQLSADRAYPIHQNIEYDLYYIRNRGFFMDMAILAHTLMFAIGRGI